MKESERALHAAEVRCLAVREAIVDLERRRELLRQAERVAEALRREAARAATKDGGA